MDDKPTLTKDLVDLELGRLNLRLMPGSRNLPAEMDELVDMVHEDLCKAGFTDEKFAAAVAEWRIRSPFMPTSADLLKVHQEMAARIPKTTQKALPPGDSFFNMGPVLATANKLVSQGVPYAKALTQALYKHGRKSPDQDTLREEAAA